MFKNKKDQIRKMKKMKMEQANFGLILNIYKNHENINHYGSLR